MKNPGRKKRNIIIVLAVMCIFGIFAGYLILGNPSFLQKAGQEAEKDIIGMYGSTQSYVFYPADEEPDADAIREYLGLDRFVHYTNGAETVALSDEDAGNCDDYVRFFLDYFKTVIDGDYEKYNTLFTEKYFSVNEKLCDFTPQMLYDINITKLSEDADGYHYDVTYRIFRNNGTFRNDIGSGGSKTLHFTLVEENGKILIDSIKYYI